MQIRQNYVGKNEQKQEKVQEQRTFEQNSIKEIHQYEAKVITPDFEQTPYKAEQSYEKFNEEPMLTPEQIGYLTDDIEHVGAAESSPDNTSPDSDEAIKKRIFHSR